MSIFRAVLGLSLSFAALISIPAGARGQEPEEEAATVERFEMPEDVFDMMAFRHGKTAATIRLSLEKELDLQIDDLGRAGRLDEAQRAAMKLAGRGDIERYFEEVEVVRRTFLAVRKDQEKFNKIGKDIQALQSRVAAGIFGAGSLFRKTLRKTAGAELAERYEATERERRRFRYRAEVEWVVAMVDNVIPLRAEARQKLIELVLEETKPPRTLGPYNHYVILWQLSKVSEEKLKPLVGDAGWPVLDHQFGQMRRIERFLRDGGWLVLEGDSETDEGTRPAATGGEK